jgi:hypothetical protein
LLCLRVFKNVTFSEKEETNLIRLSLAEELLRLSMRKIVLSKCVLKKERQLLRTLYFSK